MLFLFFRQNFFVKWSDINLLVYFALLIMFLRNLFEIPSSKTLQVGIAVPHGSLFGPRFLLAVLIELLQGVMLQSYGYADYFIKLGQSQLEYELIFIHTDDCKRKEKRQ